MSKKSHWIYGLLVLVLILSCNSPRRQKKINDGKLYEKLQAKKGYLNADELQRLQLDFSLTALDKYDLSGFDEEDTLGSFVRSGNYLWIASCYLGDEGSPFFCLKETPEKGLKVLKQGVIPELYGECSYDLDQLLIPVGKYIIVSQRSSGSGYCDENPKVFHADGREVMADDRLQIIIRNCWGEDPDNPFCFERTFRYEFHRPFLLIHLHEKKINWETEETVGTSDFDLRYLLQTNRIAFQDTVYR
ncbi:MAG: hypothetical protein ACO1N0_17780 [Fluviicola sp.]